MFYPLEGAQEAAQVSAMLADLLGTSPTPSRQFTQAVNEHKKMTLRIQALWHYFSFLLTPKISRDISTQGTCWISRMDQLRRIICNLTQGPNAGHAYDMELLFHSCVRYEVFVVNAMISR